MPSEQETDGADHGGFTVDVDWLLSGVIQLSVGAAAAALFGQFWPGWSVAIFIWGAIAARNLQHSISLESDERGREQLVFSWPWK